MPRWKASSRGKGKVMKYNRLRGTQDIIPPIIYKWRHVERIFEKTFEKFGYEGIRTPIIETTELFRRAVGEDTEIITKEMYTFTDRGGRSLTLRPENTASVVRAYLENGMHRKGGITRLYYFGPMFRYERPQAGRYRQFHQVGAEAIGSLNPAVDVEVMDMVMHALDRMGFRDLSVKINSVGCPVCRKDYRKLLLNSLNKVKDRLCPDCKERYEKNPLRIFDCKKCGDIKMSLPEISSHLCRDCESHFSGVKAGLDALGTPYEFDPMLVRGLDYYTKTTFEIVHGELGAQNALCGGGRYDDLVEECGGPPTPAVGFSAGLERIISVLPETGDEKPPEGPSPDYYVVCLDEVSSNRALKITRVLREYGRVLADFSLRSIKKQLRGAEKGGAAVALIVDSNSPERVMWREMATRKQFEVRDDEIAGYAADRSKSWENQ
jgi:histidyl-tRNA synthetase